MSIARQLLQEMRPLFRMLDGPFTRSSFNGTLPPLTQLDPFETFTPGPAIDVSEDGDKYKVDADVPGIPKENVEIRIGDNGRSVTIEGKVVQKEESEAKNPSAKSDSPGNDSKAVAKSDENSISLSSERPFTRSVSFTRTVWLPRPVDPKNVSAKLDHGVLSLVLNKAQDRGSTIVPID